MTKLRALSLLAYLALPLVWVCAKWGPYAMERKREGAKR
jgi:hypothetical protein